MVFCQKRTGRLRLIFFFSSRRRHTRCSRDWSSDVCSSDLRVRWTEAESGFLPDQDQGYLLVNVQLPDSASVQRTLAVMDRVERIALGDDTGKDRKSVV